METQHTSLSITHARVITDAKFLSERREPLSCVYLIDGLYVGATNDLKRRIREYIGRAKRNEKSGIETPIMAYIKKQLAGGHHIRFCVLCTNPLKEGNFIQRFSKRGVKLLNNLEAPDYKSCYGGSCSFYEGKRINEGRNSW